MSEIITPDMIVAELRQVRELAGRVTDAIGPAEAKFDEAEAVWQDAYDIAYELAEGTVALREIAARRASKDQKLAMDVASVGLNRVKAKIRQLESSQSNLQTQFKAIAITYVEAGR